MWKRGFACLLFVIFLMASSVISSIAVGNATIDIFVVDAREGKPLEGAIVILYDENNKISQISDSKGQCSFLAPANMWYQVLAFSDNPSTPGHDYVPSVFTVYLQEDAAVNYVFKLLPGATIRAIDDAYFLNISQSGSSILFTVTNATNGKPLYLSNSLAFYGYGFPSFGNPPWEGENWQPRVLGLDVREIVVPANIPVSIDVKTIAWSAGWYGQEFVMDNDGGFYNLTQGELIQESLSKYSLRKNFVTSEKFLNLTSNLVSETAAIGFYVNVERRDLTQASSLIKTANEFYLKGDYSTSHSYLREAYVFMTNVEDHIKEIYDSANLTTFVGPIFLSVMAVTFGFLFSEDVHQRYGVSLIALSIFLTVFYFLFPGCKITGVLPISITSLFSLFLLLLVIPLLFHSKSESKELFIKQPPVRTLIWSIFSVAKRNLKRKKLRSSLSIINLSIMVFAFIALTSVSVELKLLILTELGRTAPSEGVLIRSFGSMASPELPLPASLLDWLNERPEVQIAVPKAENIPQFYPLANLTSSNGTKIQIRGILGIWPSLEKSVTNVQEAIVSGRFLEDNMTTAILLSRRAVDKLGVKVGDHLFINNITLELVGIVEDVRIEDCMDLDGRSILPQKLTMTFVGPTTVDCASDEVIITTFSTALMAPNTMISRVNVKLRENVDVLAFSKLVVFSRGFDVWAATAKGIVYIKVGQALQSIGLTSVMPLFVLVILSVGLHFIGAINERNVEIFSMSSLGMNPSHIAIMFIAEAMTMGFISGGIGYLGGLSIYKVLTYFPSDLMVKQKTSIVWALVASLSTIGTATLASVLPALKASAIVTPSFQRKWSVKDQGERELDGTWVFTMPVRIPAATINFFCDFLERRLRDRSRALSDRVENIHFSSEEEPDYLRKTIQFRYISGEIESEGFTIDNEIDLVKEKNTREYSIHLKGRLVYLNQNAESRIHENISFLRRLILEWTMLKFKIVSPEGYYPNHLYTLVKNFHPTTVNLIAFKKNPGKRISDLSLRLGREGEPVPKFNLTYVKDFHNVEEILEKVGETLKEEDINIACINGGPESICSILAVEANKKKTTLCCVWDDRPVKEQRRKPYSVGKVVKID